MLEGTLSALRKHGASYARLLHFGAIEHLWWLWQVVVAIMGALGFEPTLSYGSIDSHSFILLELNVGKEQWSLILFLPIIVT
jgi:hypothetical protein